MPLIDMPLEELRDYNGINPKPSDFDKFWDSSLAEMNLVDAKPEFVPHEYNSACADFYDLTFTSTKNACIYAKFAKPKNVEGKIPAVIIFHGLAGSSPNWLDLLPYVSQGFCVAAMDCRGQGGLSTDVGGVVGTTYTTPFTRGIDGEPSDLLYRDIFLDCALLAKIIMKLKYVDAKRVGVTGVSQGGGLSLACAALVPQIKLCAPVYPYLSDYKRVWNMDLDKGAYEGLRYYFRMFDPRHEREDEIFYKLGYIDVQHLAPRIKAKVLMGTGLMDTTCPPSTQFAAYNKIKSEKQVLIYPDYAHEALRGHADVIFNFMSEL